MAGQHLATEVSAQPTHDARRQEEPVGARRALARSYAVPGRERRAQSQPLNSSPHDSDSDAETSAAAQHLSRADRFSIDSEAGRCSHDSGIRSSTHSSSSTATTSSSLASRDPPPAFHEPLLAEALWDHVAMLADELPFRLGDLITVVDSSSSTDLWFGSCRERTGWFPASYVRLRKGATLRNLGSAETVDYYPAEMRRVRRKVVEELMDTERDYVTLLGNLVQVGRTEAGQLCRASWSSASDAARCSPGSGFANSSPTSKGSPHCTANFSGNWSCASTRRPRRVPASPMCS